MWVWRDEAVYGTGGAGSAGGTWVPEQGRYGGRGWRLDASGTWAWDEPSPLERPGIGVDALRGARTRSTEPVPDARVGDDATPIFHALTVDRTRRTILRAVPDAVDARDASGCAPRRRGLADVPTVPPPPAPGGSAPGAAYVADAPPAGAESPADELRRRAERRRRPHGVASTDGGSSRGRHALRTAEPVGGRHAMR